MATPTKAQTFYPTTSTDDQAFTGEATIRALEEANPAANATTRAEWTTTTAQTRTWVPFATTTTNSDTSQNNGWTFENTTTDALVSTATDKRIFLAGVWQFNLNVVKTATPLLSTAASCIATVRVYRVATGGGTRSSLFTAASANITGSGTVTINSASQPVITLEAGEVVMIGITIVSAAFTATVIGGATTMDLDLQINNTTFVVPTPGVRTASTRSFDLDGRGTVTRVLAVDLSRSAIGKGEVTHTKAVVASKTFTLDGRGTPTHSKLVVAARTFSLVGKGEVSRVIAVAEDFDLTGVGTPTYSRAVVAAKSFTLDGRGTVSREGLISAMLERSLVGKGTITEVHPVQAFRTFSLVGKGQILTAGANGSTITLPIDEVPEGGGGGTTINYIFGVIE